MSKKENMTETEESDGIFITLISEGGDKYTIPRSAVELSSVIAEELECQEDGEGDGSGNVYEDVTCTCKIKSPVLQKVAEFMTYHATVEAMNPIVSPFKTDRINQIVQKWYADFIHVDRSLVFEIVLAANFLDITPLLRLAVLAVAVDITGLSADEIRTIFNISNNLDDPEEKRKVMEENAWAFEAKRKFEEETGQKPAHKESEGDTSNAGSPNNDVSMKMESSSTVDSKPAASWWREIAIGVLC